MEISNVSSTSYSVPVFAENKNNDPNITAYNELSKKWNTYSSNAYLSLDFREDMKEKLDELKNLIDTNKEGKKNEEIAKLIASLTAIINGSDSMMSLANRVNCLKNLSVFSIDPKNKDISETYCKSINKKLNTIEPTYSNVLDFRKELCSSILDKYLSKLDETVKKNLEAWINDNNKISTEAFIDDFYKEIIEKVCSNKKNKDDLKESDSNELTTTTYNSLASFFNDLTQRIVAYSVYKVEHKVEQDNSSSAARSNLSNQTISMKVMQESNAYKLLEIDNLVSETLAKRAEMDPAMKRLRDGVYWGDNKDVKPQESIKPEDELWTKKQE